jgi:hypothetical protein
MRLVGNVAHMKKGENYNLHCSLLSLHISFMLLMLALMTCILVCDMHFIALVTAKLILNHIFSE